MDECYVAIIQWVEDYLSFLHCMNFFHSQDTICYLPSDPDSIRLHETTTRCLNLKTARMDVGVFFETLLPRTDHAPLRLIVGVS